MNVPIAIRSFRMGQQAQTQVCYSKTHSRFIPRKAQVIKPATPCENVIKCANYSIIGHERALGISCEYSNNLMTMIFPMRINKYLAEKKICSRREADKLIAGGRVLVNSKKAELGMMIKEGDEVKMAGNLKKLVYIAYNKPAGIVTGGAQKGERAISDVLELEDGVFPLGRLDKESRGLILLTNDGRITDRLLNPDNYHEKEYEVKVDKKLRSCDITQLRNGVMLNGSYITKKCKARKTGDCSFAIVLTEGKNRQIRRMCAALGYDVVDLKRIRIMNVRLDSIPEGHYKILTGEKLEELLSDLGLMEE